MKFDPRKHHRTSTRLQGFDYSLAGAYFITFVTYQREMLFGEIVDGETPQGGRVRLNRRGEIVQQEWFRSAEIRKEIRLFADEFVVMPNHAHGIVWIMDNQVGADGRPPLHIPSRKPRSLGSFVAGFKSSVTKRIRDELPVLSEVEGNETGIWQRNFHDRIIRDDRELNAIRKYIESNPRNWTEDDENLIVRK